MASMNALVKELVLLGGWLAFAAFGYYAVSRLGDFLEQCQAEGEAAYDLPEEQGDLNIAAASPWAMQAGSQVLKAMQREHPYLHCTLSMGEEPELLDALGCGYRHPVFQVGTAQRGPAEKDYSSCPALCQ